MLRRICVRGLATAAGTEHGHTEFTNTNTVRFGSPQPFANMGAACSLAALFLGCYGVEEFPWNTMLMTRTLSGWLRLPKLLLLCCFLLAPPVSASELAMALFQDSRAALYQIKVIDSPSGNRSALGSGFAIGGRLVATNYHVISQYLSKPGKVEIMLHNHQQQDVRAQLVAIDVINDLALLATEEELPLTLELASNNPVVGETLFALGNPYDLGMSVTEGIYNGVKGEAFPPRIHFSGPVNSGMSGGPTLNGNGQVVGINVATARNSVGFLVPVDSLNALVENSQDLSPMDDKDMLAVIGAQLTSTQDELMAALLAQDWPAEEFGGASVPDKGAEFISCCWGFSEEADEETGITSVSRGCNSGNMVRLDRKLSTTYIEYEFAHLHSDTLNSYQLFNAAAGYFRLSWPPNRVSKEHASNFHCVENNLQVDAAEGYASTRFKVLYCTRAYREFQGLYDAFFVGMTTDREEELLFTHFTLSGFSQSNIELFLQRFLESVRWQS